MTCFWNNLLWLFNISILSVPDEDYSRNVSCAPNWIYTFALIDQVRS